MAIIKDTLLVNSIIGEGTKFRGDFELSGLLRIDGDFEGSIDSEGKVLVGQHGSAITPGIKAKIVIIGGKVDGNIYASEKVTILSTGQLNGNIETPRLIAEEGVFLNGNLKVVHGKNQKPIHDDEEELQEARKELGVSGSIPAIPASGS